MTTNTATAIKAIPTLYGEEARRFRDMACLFFSNGLQIL